MTLETRRQGFDRTQGVDQRPFENWRVADLLPPGEVLEAVRAGGRIPILNLKNPRQTCFLACGYCDTLDRAADLSYGPGFGREKVSGFIDLLGKDYGLQAVTFCGDGEPLADWGLITHFLDQRLRLSLFTNGALLTRERAEILTWAEAIVKVKFDALDPQLFGRILLARTGEVSGKMATVIGRQPIAGIEEMVAARERWNGQPGKLIASIVVTNVNFPPGMPIEDSPLGAVLRYCRDRQIHPQVNYVEPIGGNRDRRYSIELAQVREVNRYVRGVFGLEPKHLFGENCWAMFAPILTTTGLMATGPFGMGCEFPLREQIGRLGEIRVLTGPKDLAKALADLEKFRRSEENKRAIIGELTRIKRRQGAYGLSGGDEILTGCGAGVEENYLLVYAATLFGARDYFERRVLSGINDILTGKWTVEEVTELIDQVKGT